MKREAEFRKQHWIGACAAESSINIQPTNFAGYIWLASLCQIVGKKELARDACNRGLVQVEVLKHSPMMCSKVLKENIEESEENLKKMIKELDRYDQLGNHQ
jgi:hypothetical protein